MKKTRRKKRFGETALSPEERAEQTFGRRANKSAVELERALRRTGLAGTLTLQRDTADHVTVTISGTVRGHVALDPAKALAWRIQRALSEPAPAPVRDKKDLGEAVIAQMEATQRQAQPGICIICRLTCDPCFPRCRTCWIGLRKMLTRGIRRGRL